MREYTSIAERPFWIRMHAPAPRLCVVRPLGALTCAAGAALTEFFKVRLHAGWDELIVVDLQDVSTIDGAGRAALHVGHEMAVDSGVSLVLSGVDHLAVGADVVTSRVSAEELVERLLHPVRRSENAAVRVGTDHGSRTRA